MFHFETCAYIDFCKYIFFYFCRAKITKIKDNFCPGKMSDYSDLDRQIEQLKQCEIIKENEVKALCAKAREILVEEGNVQRVDSPVTVSIYMN